MIFWYCMAVARLGNPVKSNKDKTFAIKNSVFEFHHFVRKWFLSLQFLAQTFDIWSCYFATLLKFKVMLLSNFIEITPRHGCSPVNLLHISRALLPKNTYGGLLPFMSTKFTSQSALLRITHLSAFLSYKLTLVTYVFTLVDYETVFNKTMWKY